MAKPGAQISKTTIFGIDEIPNLHHPLIYFIRGLLLTTGGLGRGQNTKSGPFFWGLQKGPRARARAPDGVLGGPKEFVLVPRPKARLVGLEGQRALSRAPGATVARMQLFEVYQSPAKHYPPVVKSRSPGTGDS